jgi:hypothetical protein
MSAAVHNEGPASPRENLATNQVRGMAVAISVPPVQISPITNGVPVDWWIAEQHPELPVARSSRIDGSHCTQEVLVNPRIAGNRPRLSRVLPYATERGLWDVFAAYKSICNVLVQGITTLDDNVVHEVLKSRIPNKSQTEFMTLLAPVSVLAKRNNCVVPKRVDNRDNGIQRHRAQMSALCGSFIVWGYQVQCE